MTDSTNTSSCKALVPYSGVSTIYRPSHFGSEIYHAVLNPGVSLAEALGLLPPNVHVEINGRRITESDWSTYKLQESDHVLLYTAPPGKDAFRTFLAILVVAAATHFIGMAGSGAAITFGSQFSVGLARGVFVALGMMAVNALVPPSLPHVPDSGNQTGIRRASITGASNQIALFQPLPKLFGTFRYFPPLAAQYFTEIAGNDQYLRMIVCLGYGPLKIGDRVITTPSTRGISVAGATVVDSFRYPDDGVTLASNTIRIGETSIEQFEGVEFRIGTVDNIGKIINVQETGLNVSFPGLANDFGGSTGWRTDEGNATVQTTATNTEEISIDLTFPSGLWTMGSDGRLNYFVATIFKVEYSPTGQGVWSAPPAYVAFKSRPSSATSTTLSFAEGLKDDPNTIFDVGLVRMYPDIFTGHKIRIVSGTGSGQERTITNTEASMVSVVYGDGLDVGYAYSYPDGVKLTVDSPWSVIPDTTSKFEIVVENGEWFIFGPTRDTMRRTFRFKVPASQYDVRLTRLKTYYEDREAVVTDAVWTALRSFRTSTPWTEDETILLELRVKASDELNGVIQDLNVLASSVVQVWDGSQWTWKVSNNPAWLYYDALTGEQVRRPVPQSRIDLDTLLEWANFCDTEGFTYNYIHDGSETLLQRIAMIATAGRGSWSMKEGKFSVVFDKQQSTPIQMISPRNASEFKMQKLFQTLPHGIRVRYVNPNTYTDDEVIAYRDGFDASNATEFEVMQTQGITDPQQAWKMGRYFLRQASLRPETYNLSMDFENLVATRGDMVKLAYDVIEVGLTWGRITDFEPSYLAFDGVDDYAEVAYNAAFDFDRTSTFSIVVRARANSTAVDKALVSKSTGSRGYSAFILRNNFATNHGSFGFTLRSDDPSQNEILVFTKEPDLDDGKFHTFAVTYDGSSSASGVKGYVDGIRKSMVVNKNNLTGSTTNANSLLWGNNVSQTIPLDGDIEESWIYNRVLTDQEIADLHNGNAISTIGLVGHWLFNQGSGSTVPDDSVNSFDASISGAQWESSVSLDQECFMQDGKTYAIRVRKTDNEQSLHTVVTKPGLFKTLRVAPPITGPSVGDLVLFGESGKESITCKVAGIEYHTDFRANLTLVPDADGIYDLGASPVFNPVLTVPPDLTAVPPAIPVIDYIESGTSSLYRDGDGSVKSSIMVGYYFTSGNLMPANEVEARYRHQHADQWHYVKVPAATGAVRLTQVEDKEITVFQLRSISKFGAASSWTDPVAELVEGKTARPSDVTNLTFDGVRLKWDHIPDIDRMGYIVRYQHEDNPVWQDAFAAHTDGYITDTELDVTHIVGAQVTFLVRAIDTTGNLSSNAATILVDLRPGSVTGLAFDGVYLTFQEATEEDVKGYIVRYNTVDDWDTATRAHNEGFITETEFDTSDLVGGEVYLLVKKIDRAGNRSEFASSIQVDLRPVAPNEFTVTTQSDGTREFKFSTANLPGDYAGTKIRYFLGSSSDWNSMNPLHEGLLTTSPYEMNHTLAAGTYTFAVKNVDLAGNESANATFINNVELGNPRIEGALLTQTEEPNWSGTKTNCHLDGATGWLVADSDGTDQWATLPAQWSGWTEWNTAPQGSMTYQIKLDAGAVTKFVPLVSVNTDGTATIEERHSDDDVNYSSFALVSGQVEGRYIEIRVTVAGTYPKLKSMLTILSGASVNEFIEDLDTSTLTGSHRIGVGDVRLPITKSYIAIRTVNVTLQSTGGVWFYELVDKDTSVGPRIRIYDSSGNLTDASIDAEVIGI